MAEEQKKEQKAEEKVEEKPTEEKPVEEKPAEKPEKKVEQSEIPTKVGKKQKPKPTGKYKELIKQIEELSVLELAELVKELEERFGVSAATPIVAAAPATDEETGPADEEEKTEFTVMLKATGDQKINVIKAVREVTDLGLKDAKDLVDGAPKEVKANVKKEEAEEIKKKLEAVGAQVELK